MSTISMIAAEMERQDAKWGSQRHLDPRTWIAVLGEEFGEVCKASLEHKDDEYITELVQVAAVAIQAIDAAMAKQKE